MDIPLNQLQSALRLLLAMLAGGLLGLERTRKLRPAGMRTYTLISVGACLVMLAGLSLYGRFGDSADPTRMAAQVVSGIGFIGAGTILTTRNHQVKGLTTAAGLWAAACLGLAIGAGMYSTALVAFLIVFAALWVADILEDRYSARLPHLQAHLILSGLDRLPALSALAQDWGVRLGEVTLSDAVGGGVSLLCTLHLPPKADRRQVMEAIQGLEGVYLAEIMPN